MTCIVAVHNKVPPHPCPSKNTNQRHTRVRHLVGGGGVAVFALGNKISQVSNKIPRQDSKMVIRFLLFMPH